MHRTRGFRLRHAAVVLWAAAAVTFASAQTTITFGGWSGEEEAAQGKLGQDTAENAKAERSAEAERKDG